MISRRVSLFVPYLPIWETTSVFESVVTAEAGLRRKWSCRMTTSACGLGFPRWVVVSPNLLWGSGEREGREAGLEDGGG